MANEGRLQTCETWRAGINAAQHSIVDARTSRYVEFYAHWRRDAEGIGGALRAKSVRA